MESLKNCPFCGEQVTLDEICRTERNAYYLDHICFNGTGAPQPFRQSKIPGRKYENFSGYIYVIFRLSCLFLGIFRDAISCREEVYGTR